MAAVAWFSMFAASCGTPKPIPVVVAPVSEAPSEPPTVNPVEETKEPDHVLPTTCSDGPMCVPPKEFASRICGGSYPEAALYMFAPKTPWKRAYLQRSFQAWQVSGRGDMRELHTNEEVLILTVNRGGGDGMQLGGRAFDVLRWDGTCVSLMEDEISFRRPPAAVPANIVWKNLEPSFQAAFAQDKGIDALRAAQARTCDSPSVNREPQKSNCEIAREQLSMAIAQSVGRGSALPALSAVP